VLGARALRRDPLQVTCGEYWCDDVIEEIEEIEEIVMRSIIKTSALLFVGVLIGAAAVNQPQAQSKPPVYVITDFTEIMDTSAFSAGAATVAAAIAAGGGKILVRTDAPVALDGQPPKRFAIFAFDSVEKAKAWESSDAMKVGQEARLKNTKSRSFIVEGLAN
jgi:uncharacterized protein (DUF1330 family)